MRPRLGLDTPCAATRLRGGGLRRRRRSPARGEVQGAATASFSTAPASEMVLRRRRSAPLDGPTRPPEMGRMSRGRRRWGARAAAAGDGEHEPLLPGFAAGEREACAMGREGDERQLSNGRDKVLAFFVLPLFFLNNYRTYNI